MFIIGQTTHTTVVETDRNVQPEPQTEALLSRCFLCAGCFDPFREMTRHETPWHVPSGIFLHLQKASGSGLSEQYLRESWGGSVAALPRIRSRRDHRTGRSLKHLYDSLQNSWEETGRSSSTSTSPEHLNEPKHLQTLLTVDSAAARGRHTHKHLKRDFLFSRMNTERSSVRRWSDQIQHAEKKYVFSYLSTL